MRRVAALLVILMGVAGVLLAPTRSTDPDPPVFRTIGSALLACPALAVTEDSASLLSALVAPAPGEPSRVAVGGSDEGEGAASLRLIDDGEGEGEVVVSGPSRDGSFTYSSPAEFRERWESGWRHGFPWVEATPRPEAGAEAFLRDLGFTLGCRP